MPTSITFPAVTVAARRREPRDFVVALAFALFPVALLLFAVAMFGFDPVIGFAAYVNG